MKYGGAISFENVDIQFETGKRATLTIYHDGEEHETVDLQDIETEDEMIQMMIDKQFRLKPQDQVAMIREIGAKAKAKEDKERSEEMEEFKKRVEEFRKKKMEEQRAREQTKKTRGDGEL